jgi:oligoribonuclease
MVVPSLADAGVDQEVRVFAHVHVVAARKQPREVVVAGIEAVPEAGKAEAERQTLDFLAQYVPAKVSPMCGNTICQDRRFLYKYMPRLAEFFHYRNLDVSTLKELKKRWAPGLPSFSKASSHLALDDIRDSIAELQHYREHFLKLPA